LDVFLKIENHIILGQKKKMLQKNTQYKYQLKSLPFKVFNSVVLLNTQDNRQKVAHLVLSDMLGLIKM
jgi:hypothetical protein